MAPARIDHIAAAAEGNFEGLLEELTTKEKIAFLAGANFWETAEIKRLGIPSLKVRDLVRWLYLQQLLSLLLQTTSLYFALKVHGHYAYLSRRLPICWCS